MRYIYKKVLKEMEKGSKFKEALAKADSSIFGILRQIGKEIIKETKKEVTLFFILEFRQGSGVSNVCQQQPTHIVQGGPFAR